MIIFVTCEEFYFYFSTSTIIKSPSTIVSTSMTIVVILIVICSWLILVGNFSQVNYMIVFLVLHIEYTFSCIMWRFFTYGAPVFLRILQIIWIVLRLVRCDFMIDFTIVLGSNQLNFLFPIFCMSARIFCMSFHHVDCMPEVRIY